MKANEISQSMANTVHGTWNNIQNDFKDVRNTLVERMESVGNWFMGNGYKPMNGVEDKTSENLGTEIVQNEKPLWQKQQELLWQREDEKQKHVEEREDTAASRYIEDLRRSGVNPNLYNGGQAASGGGITNATQADYSMDIAEFNKAYELLMQEIELNFKGDQAEKDRIAGLVKSLIHSGAILGGIALKSSK